VGRLVVRAVVFEPETVARAEVAAPPRGLEAWLGPAPTGGGVSVALEALRPRRLGLLVQRLPGEAVEQLWWPLLRVEEDTGRLLCRYHEGPRGEPWRHRYCSRAAATRDGYCLAHRRSAKALYERCAQGVDEACREADRLLRGEEYTIYALDYGGARVKVGLTQSWRLLWRIAEQPHVSAAAVASASSLVEARGVEKRLGRLRGATEGSAARLEDRARAAARMLEGYSPEAAARRLASLIAGLGLRGRYRGYTVLPHGGPPGWAAAAGRPGGLPPGAWRLLDYWGGLLLFENEAGARVVVAKRSLLHRVLVAEAE